MPSIFACLRSRGVWAALAAFGFLGACFQGAARPTPVAGGTLTLSREGADGDRPSGPLKVAFASPEGDVGIVTEVTVVFDRAVHPLGVVSEGPPPFRITPEVPGTFRWVGSRAAVFTPRQRLPFATRFVVEVPAGLQALDGTRLPAPHQFALETRRPGVTSTSPSQNQRGLPLQPELRLELNQSVNAAALRSAAKLKIGSPPAETSVPFEVKTVEKEPRVLLVKPTRRLPPASQAAKYRRPWPW